ncbi:MAG: M23 family metallopeptidase [Chitinophagaceae bacterium]|nr:M23 family metallopeptidase [Chitinophagaceae bacterium]
MKLVLASLFLSAICFGQDQYSIRDLKNGKFKEDSSHIYDLPFENKKRVFLVQAYESKMSHKGERALDFKVKKGAKICAARAGVILGVREDSDKGGLKDENLSDGNYISIKHNDGSVAHYWHLKKDGAVVSVGDSVEAGQWIGLSGNTGYSAFPHLHFEVQGYDATGHFKQLATRFYTNKGVIYLRPGKFYRTRH